VNQNLDSVNLNIDKILGISFDDGISDHTGIKIIVLQK
jgi:hypothetical protein